MSEPPIYMDHHATTPVDERVLAAMLPYFVARFGNAASRAHAHGTAARDAVELGRAQVAGLLDAKPEEVIFTSGATESDNLAIRGAAQARLRDGNHIVTVRTEHKAVLDTCAALEREGWRVTWLDVDAQGLISRDAVAEALTDETVLISVMLANNEVGVVQDLAAVGALASERGITFHCDAAQGLGYLPFSVDDMNIDLVSMSAHKMYGPKGVGALYIREALQTRGIPLPQMHGGGHERGFRSGTLNVPGIVGFGAAAEIMKNEGAAEAVRLESLRDGLKDHLLDAIEEVRLNAERQAPVTRATSTCRLDTSTAHGCSSSSARSRRFRVARLAAVPKWALATCSKPWASPRIGARPRFASASGGTQPRPRSRLSPMP
jgi:cysteine desulfurase